MYLIASFSVQAERLPVKIYTTADGLASNKISRIARDSRGFLWFCTEDGLSRFDGYGFTNYTTQQGLPTNWVDDFLETRAGVFLVGTTAGLCVFDPKGVPVAQDKLATQPNVQPMFAVYRPDEDEFALAVKLLYEDGEDNIWCGTRRGLYRIELANHQVAFHPIDLGILSKEVTDHLSIQTRRRGRGLATAHLSTHDQLCEPRAGRVPLSRSRREL